ncbi:MAG: hypothetical protein FWE86_00870 [Oscillospiraceae bacterium]|nr:hypothetical protein [Oscillospiraceae bacterium]
MNMFEQAEKRLINGYYAKDENIIAFCHILTHRGYLSKTLVKSHDCITKECPFFERLRPEYWEAVGRREEKIKINRIRKKQIAEEIENRNAFIKETLEQGGHIYVTSIKDQSRKILVISYIYDEWTDLTPEIDILRKKLKKSIRLTARVGSAEAIELLIRRRKN